MTAGTKVAIVGGGMGGLTAALALRQCGFEATVYEQSPALREIGAGIQITPNAAKVIKELGLYDRLLEKGFLPEATVGLDWKTGRETFRTPLAGMCEATFGAEYFQILRSDMQSILLEALPNDAVQLTRRCTGVEIDGDRASLLFEDGTSVVSDLIIGADGIRSATRRSLFGDISPRYTGHICYRTVIPIGAPDYELVLPACNLWLGPQAHVVTYYVHNGTAVNVGAIVEQREWSAREWVQPSSPAELVEAFKGWSPTLCTLLERSEVVQKWALFDCDPMPAWGRGPVTLLGDAAHSMLPFLSQGAGMAIEDGYVIARALKAASSVPEALAFYESARRPRTTRIQLNARARGKTYHRRSPVSRFVRDADNFIRGLINPYAAGMRTDWIYSHDVTRLSF